MLPLHQQFRVLSGLLTSRLDRIGPLILFLSNRQVLDYNIPGGKLNRGISVIDTAEILKGRPLTDDEYMRAAVLGWGIEFVRRQIPMSAALFLLTAFFLMLAQMQAFFLVSDDLMDSSVTRRGQPCWYRQPDVGTIAVNDALLLEGAMYQMLRKHFRGQPYYTDLMDLFHEVSYETEMGQLVDLITAPEDKVDLSKFSLERYVFRFAVQGLTSSVYSHPDL